MRLERPARRMTLREVLTHAEKCARDLIDHYQGNVLMHTSDFRDLNRPVRRRSNYPTLLALQNALQRLEEATDEALVMGDYLLEQLETIRKGARRELANQL